MADEEKTSTNEEELDIGLNYEVPAGVEIPDTTPKKEDEPQPDPEPEVDKTAELEGRVDKLLKANDDLKARLDDQENLLANPEKLLEGVKKEDKEPNYDDLDATSFANTIEDRIVGKVSKMLEDRFKPIQQREQQKQQDELIQEATKQKQACEEKYKDWKKYEKTIGERAMAFQREHGLPALIGIGIDTFYKAALVDAASNRVKKAPAGRPSEKPGESASAATPDLSNPDAAFDQAWGETVGEGTFLE